MTRVLGRARLGRLFSFLACFTCMVAYAAPGRELIVEAPSALKALLDTNLDAKRAARLPEQGGEAEPLDDGEWARLIAAAPAQARELAQTLGYFHPEITVETDTDNPSRAHLRLIPGPQAIVGRVTLNFDGELASQAERGVPAAVALQAALRESWLLQPKAPFRNANWVSAKGDTLAKLRANGYASALWTATSAQVDPATNQARLFLVGDSGPLFRAGELVVEGLQRQSEKSVRLLAGFGAGAALTETRLRDYQDRLDKTGLFDQVAVLYNPDPAQAEHATVTVRVHEQSLHQATASVGISSTTGPRITLAHTNRQLFGLAATSTNKLQWGRDLQEWDGSITTHPAEKFQSWLLGASLSRTVGTEDVVRAGYVRFGRTQDSNALERLSFVQFERSIQCAAVDCVDARALSINQHGIWRRLDSVVLPTEGYSLSAQLGLGQAGGPNSAYGPYARLYGRATGYWPLRGDWYSQARLELGQVIVRDGVAMPDAELFRAGGEESVRGYAWRTLAPEDLRGNVVGGKALVTTSFELAHPLTASLPSVWWAVFMDAGRAAPRFNDLKMALGYGLGMRWRSPVGPLKVDWSWGEEIHRGRIDLSIGIAF